MKHFNVTFEPDGRQVSIHAGATLLEAAGQAGIILNSVCGGKGTCKKCLVNLQPDNKQVLACQYHIDSDLTVTIPTASRFFEQKILAHGIDIEARIRRELPAEAAHGFGLAVDIGTTTVVAKLIDMTTGGCAATAAALNPQARHGDDVISRIAYAQTDDKLAELQKLIIDCINDLIAKLCNDVSLNAEQIQQACIVGNTTMNHIFLKFPVASLGRAPYDAYSLDAHDLPAANLALKIDPQANVHTVENIAGFVGSDTTAVALAVEVDSAEQVTLVVDIGTNGELVLGTADKLYAASCAAGPALEGARIKCGSRAVAGAIEAVFANDDDMDVDVIGGRPPHSICGSGLVDAVAVLLDLGIIERSGRFVEPAKLKTSLPPAVFARLIEYDSQPAFVIAQADSQKVFLTQRDIREVQLAKAAISAGTKLLQRKLQLQDDDIKQILLAGAFGNYIRRESAVRIGLLPDVPIERIRFVGNAAGSGAQMVLLSTQFRQHARELARKIEYVEVAHEKDFEYVFADAMAF